ncbi:hypothetical protein O1611_g5478 [Lasiodiplodia mahajangana]|uniref:Uncharacterized protein n=1 Tax=Lasiodiplodia mahajangana TaxID=1108764 RepID=A0ACC2JL15_9PEZI|nr:hypothetical protein O1611_g5478 [Lasiodiplodia mahajangana]
MSAFALRKKLLAQQNQAALASIDQTDVTVTSVSTDAKKPASTPQKKARKTKAARAEQKETPSQSNEVSPAQSSIVSPGFVLDQADQVPRRSPSPSSIDGGEEDYAANGPAQPVNFSSFRPSKSNFRVESNGVSHLKLDEGERLVIFGSYGVRVKSGEVTVYGATLGPSDSVSWVHAPQSHALPVIRCSNDATLELHPHPSAQDLQNLGLLSPLFRRLWWETPVPSSHGNNPRSSETYRILYTSEDGPKKSILQDLKSPPEWNREIAALVASKRSAPSSVMITGPKSSGKSTFGKILTNRLLTGTPTHAKKPSNGGVVVLDLDPGQPEYCGAGQIALILVTNPVLSPSFCRPLDTLGMRIIRSHALASLSPASDPELYTEMALDLITHYRNAFASYPLVINTPGWIQGTGLDLLVSLISELRLSEVIYMSLTGPIDVVEALQGACKATRFSTLPSQPSQNSLRSAANLRSMQTMAYFHAEAATKHNGGDHPCWFKRPLTAMAPLQVRFRGANRGIFGVLYYDFQTQPDLVADAINGTVIAVVEVESAKAFRDIETDAHAPDTMGDEPTPMDLDISEANQDKPPSLEFLQRMITTLTTEGIPYIDTSHGLTLDPRYTRSLGLALVRGIDVENGDLHLLSPIATHQIEESGDDDADGNEGIGSDSQVEGTEIDLENMRGDNTANTYDSTGSVPWIEVLTRNQKRGAGSKVWRVRRDLGRVGIPAD